MVIIIAFSLDNELALSDHDASRVNQSLHDFDHHNKGRGRTLAAKPGSEVPAPRGAFD